MGAVIVGKIPKNVQRLENFVQKSMMFGQGCTTIYIWFSYLMGGGENH